MSDLVSEPDQLPIAAGQVIPFWPRGKSGPLYRIRVASILEAEDFEVEKARAGVRFQSNADLCTLMTAEIEARGDGFGELVNIADLAKNWFVEQAGLEAEDRSAMPEDFRQLFIDLEAELLRSSDTYRAAVAERSASLNKLALTACRMFVVGWDGVDVPCVRGLDGRLTEPTLSALIGRDKLETITVGLRANALAQPGADTRKNLPSPSRSTPSPKASPAKDRSTAVRAGSPVASNTRKTPRKR